MIRGLSLTTSIQWLNSQVCAIIGGVFTVASIVDKMIYKGQKMARKLELGKDF